MKPKYVSVCVNYCIAMTLIHCVIHVMFLQGNVAEVQYLRPWLMKPKYISVCVNYCIAMTLIDCVIHVMFLQGNVAEVQYLRPWLMKPKYVSVCELLYSHDTH